MGMKEERAKVVVEILADGPKTTEGLLSEVVGRTSQMSAITLRKICAEMAKEKLISGRKIRCKRHPAGVLVWSKRDESPEAVSALVRQVDARPNGFSMARSHQ